MTRHALPLLALACLAAILTACQTPEHDGTARHSAEAESELATLLDEGKALFKESRYREARDRFEELIVRDPYNEEAVRYLKVLQEVLPAEAKKPPSKLQQKLSTIIIPRISFEDATIQTVVTFLKERTRELDVEGEGVNIILRPSPGGDGNSAPQGEEPGDGGLDPFGGRQITVTLDLTNIPLGEAIRYICQEAGLDYRVEEFAVAINPDGRMRDVANLMEESKALFKESRYTDARDRFEELLVRDPYNAEAVQYLRVLQEVLPAEAKEPPSKLQQKLSTIIIPRISFKDATIQTVVTFTKQRTRELDVEGEGVNIILRASPGDDRVTIDMDNMPLGEAIRYICQGAGLKYRVDEYAVVISETLGQTPQHDGTARQVADTHLDLSKPIRFTLDTEGLSDEESLLKQEQMLRAMGMIDRAVAEMKEGTISGFEDAADLLQEAQKLLDQSQARPLSSDQPTVSQILAHVQRQWALELMKQTSRWKHHEPVDEAEHLLRRAAELDPTLRSVIREDLRDLDALRKKVEAWELAHPEIIDPEITLPESFVGTTTNGSSHESFAPGVEPFALTNGPSFAIAGEASTFSITDGGFGQSPGEDSESEAMAFASHIDEVWIVQIDSEREQPRQAPTEYPALKAQVDDQEIPLPLEHTEVEAAIAGFIATVDVTQQYANPYETKIEAVYVFPLPEDAAVSDFLLKIGERTIRGVIREREEAEQIYAAAKAQGHRAAIMTQERPNIFTQKVANIEPQARIDVQLTYFSPVARVGDAYEFTFPMVVGPRFNPPGSSDGVGAVPAGQRGASGQASEVQYLPPDTRSGHDIMLSVDIAAGMAIEAIESPTHVVDIERPAADRARVRLGRHDTLPNRDFVLRYTLAGEQTKTACLVAPNGAGGGYFALMVEPPAGLTEQLRQPREMVFVLDCSGSMNGLPMAKSKEAIRRSLKRLEPGDAFQIIRFSDSASSLGAGPLAATEENIARALRYVETLQGQGGTMMAEGITSALSFERDATRQRIVCFMTDGYIGNEAEVLRIVGEHLGDARIFSFGIGSSVNRYLLTEMARLGNGAAAFVTLDEPAMDAVDRFFERASFPALSNLAFDWHGAQVGQIYPGKPSDLFVGRPVLLTGRYDGTFPEALTLSGEVQGEARSFTIPVSPVEHPGIVRVWARHRLGDLHMGMITADSDDVRAKLDEAMVKTSLTHQVLCARTAMLAVDSLEVTAGEEGVSVDVPVPVPHGVKHKTTVQP